VAVKNAVNVARDASILKKINVKSTVSIGSLGGVLFTPRIQMKNYTRIVVLNGRNKWETQLR